MTEKLIRIITLCEHGKTEDHCRFEVYHPSWDCRARCPGGSVVELTRQEAIKKVAWNLNVGGNGPLPQSAYDTAEEFVDALLEAK